MPKKTVNVSEQLITSILIGFALSLAVVFTAHLLPKEWSFMPANSSGGYFSMDDGVFSCVYRCALGKWHACNCAGLKAYEVGNQTLDVGDLFSATFDRHSSLILILGVIGTVIIYGLKRLSFKVVKE